GYGTSLERICPTAKGEWENWTPSTLAIGAPRPGGTPGMKNANFAPRLPPVIENLTTTPPHAKPGEDVRVEADVRSADGAGSVELRYRVAGSGTESAEMAVAMAAGAKGRYSATVPGQKNGQIIRVRIRAVDAKGTLRSCPSENDVRPALSVY